MKKTHINIVRDERKVPFHVYSINMRRHIDTEKPEGYMFFMPNGSWWKQKLAKWAWTLLAKLKALAPFEYKVERFIYDEVKQKKLTNLVFAGLKGVLERGEDPANYCAIVGYTTFDEFMAEECKSFPSTDLIIQNSNYRYCYRGLPIWLVPGMEGAAVIPKNVIEARREQR